MKPLGLLVLAASVLQAQQPDIGSRLIERGASPELAQEMRVVTTAARAESLPTGPIADKAFEGLAKGYPAERIIPVVRGLVDRLRAGREVVVGAGLARPPGALVAAVAEGLGRGLDRADLVDLLRSAPTPDDAAIGVTVAASLAAQGITAHEAARAVTTAFREGHSSKDLLELPSVASGWIAEGVTLPEVAKRIRHGMALPVPPGRGAVKATPGKGPPINPPGKSRRP